MATLVDTKTTSNATTDSGADTAADTRVPKVLCLGVSYPSLKRTLQSQGLDDKDVQELFSCDTDNINCDDESVLPVVSEDSSCASIASSSSLSSSSLSSNTTQSRVDIQAVLKCVEQNYLTEMDGRDLARCLATEQHCGVQLYTVSQEEGAQYEPGRHVYANFNRPTFVHTLQKQLGRCRRPPTNTNNHDTESSLPQHSPQLVQFDQVILDYYWIPHGWDVHHWNASFFRATLVELARANVLKQRPSPPSETNKIQSGVVYLPFCFHCFQEVLANFDSSLAQYYNVSFLRKTQLEEVLLWAGTQQIGAVAMQATLGKRRDQEEVYCTFGPNDIRGALDDPRVSKARLIDVARRLEDFADIRFIVLTRIPNDDDDDTTSDNHHKKGVSRKRGQIQGLMRPSQVQRGLDQMMTRSEKSSTDKKSTTLVPTTPQKKPINGVHVVTPCSTSKASSRSTYKEQPNTRGRTAKRAKLV